MLNHPRAKLHLYGKELAKWRRKMGHFTVLGSTVDEALTDARRIQASLGTRSASIQKRAAMRTHSHDRSVVLGRKFRRLLWPCECATTGSLELSARERKASPKTY